jgi:DNA-binding HxlR family transcriptional regulator
MMLTAFKVRDKPQQCNPSVNDSENGMYYYQAVATLCGCIAMQYMYVQPGSHRCQQLPLPGMQTADGVECCASGVTQHLAAIALLVLLVHRRWSLAQALFMKARVEQELQRLHTIHQDLLQQQLLSLGAPGFLLPEVQYSLASVERLLKDAGHECTLVSTANAGWASRSHLDAASMSESMQSTFVGHICLAAPCHGCAASLVLAGSTAGTAVGCQFEGLVQYVTAWWPWRRSHGHSCRSHSSC